jgi:hypothetical protein
LKAEPNEKWGWERMQNVPAFMIFAIAITLTVGSVIEAVVAIKQTDQLSITADDKTISGLPPVRLLVSEFAMLLNL